jgi:hypothetical protein
VPDIQQLLVLAFALVPGFVAAESQAFVAFRRLTPSAEKLLLAVSYSAGIYLLSSIGAWGPQFDQAFARLYQGDMTAIYDQGLLARYLLLLGVAVGLGVISGRSLASGRLRAILAKVSGRNVAASTWVEFFRDRSSSGFWFQFRDGKRIAGTIRAASDSAGEQVIVVNRPKWVGPDGHLFSMNLQSILVQGSDCNLIGEVLKADLAIEEAENGDPSQG